MESIARQGLKTDMDTLWTIHILGRIENFGNIGVIPDKIYSHMTLWCTHCYENAWLLWDSNPNKPWVLQSKCPQGHCNSQGNRLYQGQTPLFPHSLWPEGIKVVLAMAVLKTLPFERYKWKRFVKMSATWSSVLTDFTVTKPKWWYFMLMCFVWGCILGTLTNSNAPELSSNTV